MSGRMNLPKGRLRWQKRWRLQRWLTLNLSRHGMSLTLGRRGLRLNIGRRGLYFTAGVPGSGFSYRWGVSWGRVVGRVTRAVDGLTGVARRSAPMRWEWTKEGTMNGVHDVRVNGHGLESSTQGRAGRRARVASLAAPGTIQYWTALLLKRALEIGGMAWLGWRLLQSTRRQTRPGVAAGVAAGNAKPTGAAPHHHPANATTPSPAARGE